MNLPTISIIVPVYNASKYLSHCLDSLVNQTYDNIEIICIDDGSKDNSLKILEQYAVHDNRIKIISQENSGVSVARNKALDASRGSYIMFVDSDDWIEHNTCEVALDAIKEHNVDLVMWDYYKASENNAVEKNIFHNDVFFNTSDVKLKLHRAIVGPSGIELSSPENADVISTVWCKLYKTEYIKRNNIYFYDIRKIGSFEDGLFNLDVFSCIDNAVYIHEHLYYYRRNQESTTNSFRNKLQSQHEHIHKYLESYISEYNLDDSYKTALNNRIAFELVGYGLNILHLPKGKIKQIKQILKTEKYHNAYKQLAFKYLPMHWKIFYRCAEYKFAAGVYLLLLCIKKLTGR